MFILLLLTLRRRDFKLSTNFFVDGSDDEGDDGDDEEDDDAAKQESELDKYQKLLTEGKAGTLPSEEVENYAGEPEEKKDKVFEKFLRVTKRAPKQVVRYSRGGKPLWVSDKEAAENIPNCELCHGPRIFEFQIMPQLLASLKLDELNGDSVDWGTLAIFSCQKSCGSTFPAYKKEFLWRQNMQH